MSMHRSASFAIAWIGVILMRTGCNPTPDEAQIDARVLSPDGKLEAVYAEDQPPALKRMFISLNQAVFLELWIEYLAMNAWVTFSCDGLHLACF